VSSGIAQQIDNWVLRVNSELRIERKEENVVLDCKLMILVNNEIRLTSYLYTSHDITWYTSICPKLNNLHKSS